jgi:hypothetical protein
MRGGRAVGQGRSVRGVASESNQGGCLCGRFGRVGDGKSSEIRPRRTARAGEQVRQGELGRQGIDRWGGRAGAQARWQKRTLGEGVSTR